MKQRFLSLSLSFSPKKKHVVEEMTGGSFLNKKAFNLLRKGHFSGRKTKTETLPVVGRLKGVTKAHRCQATRKVPMIS